MLIKQMSFFSVKHMDNKILDSGNKFYKMENLDNIGPDNRGSTLSNSIKCYKLTETYTQQYFCHFILFIN